MGVCMDVKSLCLHKIPVVYDHRELTWQGNPFDTANPLKNLPLFWFQQRRELKVTANKSKREKEPVNKNNNLWSALSSEKMMNDIPSLEPLECRWHVVHE